MKEIEQKISEMARHVRPNSQLLDQNRKSLATGFVTMPEMGAPGVFTIVGLIELNRTFPSNAIIEFNGQSYSLKNLRRAKEPMRSDCEFDLGCNFHRSKVNHFFVQEIFLERGVTHAALAAEEDGR